jgi:hypothetical protein
MQRKRKAGRPRLPKRQAKGEAFRVRATPEEMKAYIAAAKATRQTVSGWIRGKLNASLEQ